MNKDNKYRVIFSNGRSLEFCNFDLAVSAAEKYINSCKDETLNDGFSFQLFIEKKIIDTWYEIMRCNEFTGYELSYL